MENAEKVESVDNSGAEACVFWRITFPVGKLIVDWRVPVLHHAVRKGKFMSLRTAG